MTHIVLGPDGPRAPTPSEQAYARLYERAEDAASAGIPLEKALEAVCNGYDSVAADRAAAEDL